MHSVSLLSFPLNILRPCLFPDLVTSSLLWLSFDHSITSFIFCFSLDIFFPLLQPLFSHSPPSALPPLRPTPPVRVSQGGERRKGETRAFCVLLSAPCILRPAPACSPLISILFHTRIVVFCVSCGIKLQSAQFGASRINSIAKHASSSTESRSKGWRVQQRVQGSRKTKECLDIVY